MRVMRLRWWCLKGCTKHGEAEEKTHHCSKTAKEERNAALPLNSNPIKRSYFKNLALNRAPYNPTVSPETIKRIAINLSIDKVS